MHIEKIQSNKFMTNEILIAITTPINEENATKNALIPVVLKRGSINYKNQLEINKKLENMYGAIINAGIEKSNDYLILKFYITSLANKYIPSNENVAQESMNLIYDIVFNPLIEKNAFNKEYIKQEKDNLKKIIESQKDNKSTYSYNRCIEEMYKGKLFGINQCGKLEDLEDINETNLYEYYKELIKSCRIDIYLNGENANDITIPQIELNNNEIYIEEKIDTFENEEPNVIRESGNVTQGKLNIGLEIKSKDKFANTMYSTILGGGANSKLFQNVREKASLAYYSSTRNIRRKNSIFIVTGIELQNYDKALSIIKEQIEDMKKGNITENEFESAKVLAISSLDSIRESQTSITSFVFDQKLFGENLSIDEYKCKLETVTLNDVIETAKDVKINTIYYLEK